MPPQVERWWVCGTCRKPVHKVGSKDGAEKTRAHLKECPKMALGIRPVPQTKR